MADWHFLLVDAQSMSQRLLRNALEPIGDITVVAGTRDARINVNRSSFDCVVVGYENDASDDFLSFVIDLRRSRNAMSAAPILFVTADYTEDMAYRAQCAGVNQTIPKPFSKEDLQQAVQLHIAADGKHVERVERRNATVTCLNWFQGGMHFVYSPDLNRLVSAPTRKEAGARMDELLQHFHWQLRDSRWGEVVPKMSKRRVLFD